MRFCELFLVKLVSATFNHPTVSDVVTIGYKNTVGDQRNPKNLEMSCDPFEQVVLSADGRKYGLQKSRQYGKDCIGQLHKCVNMPAMESK